jgi:DNA polymerase III subunit chi
MPSQVSFYILQDERQPAYWQFCCRLLQKIYQQKSNVHVHCSDPQSAKQLNVYLWTFNDTSFIPHCFADDPMTITPMVRIGYAHHTPQTSEVLLNLSDTIPAFFQQFSRILEIVTPQARDQGRNHYRHYQQHHCQVETHKIYQ